MADTPAPLTFDTAFAPQTGLLIPVAPGIGRVTAPNAGPFTFTGTNSFFIGHDSVALLDPGPADPRHLAALLAALGGRRLEAILLTHTHRDHSDGVAALRRATGAPVWFGGPHRLSRPLRRFERNPLARDCDWSLQPDRTLADGETIDFGGVALQVVATPGHCANHLAFAVASTGLLLTGDHIMGWNSTLVAVPDGSMADYLASLDKVLALPATHYLPAHGGPIADGPAYARALLAHRQLRNRQIADAVASGITRLGALAAHIYPRQSPAIRHAARLTLAAHAEYLAAQGIIRLHHGPLGTRLSRV